MPYKDSANKALIRTTWDLPLLKLHSERLGKELTYFGMCGPEMHDIRDWKEVIGAKCCIEAEGNSPKERKQLPYRVAQMRAVAQIYGVADEMQQLVGKVEDIIVTGLDSENKRPLLTEPGESAEDTRFRYDLYNLDFDGGLGFSDQYGNIPRTRSLSKLFDRQAGHDFMLLLTVNVRDTIGGALNTYLDQLSGRRYGSDWKEVIDWHRKRGQSEHAYLLKAAVPVFVQRHAEARNFEPKCYPPIVYDGYNSARLVHFVFDFRHVGGKLSVVAEQEERELLALPFLRSANGALKVISQDAPGFHAERSAKTLEPLTSVARKAAISSISRKAGGGRPRVR